MKAQVQMRRNNLEHISTLHSAEICLRLGSEVVNYEVGDVTQVVSGIIEWK
jgi:hypothetical protein